MANTIERLKELWEQFGDVPINENEEIDVEWEDWEKGTDRFEIWHWFDEQYPVCKLMGLE